jgi:hypothetical protein
MDRKDFLRRSLETCLGCGALFVAGRADLGAGSADGPSSGPSHDAAPSQDELRQLRYKNEFLNNWLSDLADTIYEELDEGTRVKLMAGCGKGCHRRHSFTQDIVNAGKGDLDRLLEAYKKSFGIRREGDLVHITYGPSPQGGCWCPAAQDRPARAGDMHCECTRAKHELIFREALGRPFKVEMLESFRRGGTRCHLVVHLT